MSMWLQKSIYLGVFVVVVVVMVLCTIRLAPCLLQPLLFFTELSLFPFPFPSFFDNSDCSGLSLIVVKPITMRVEISIVDIKETR